MKKKMILILLFCTLKVGAQTSTFSIADNLLEKGRYKLALKELEKIKPTSFLTNYKMAVIYESIDSYTKTAYFLEKALTFKENYKAKLKLAKAYQRLKKTNNAIEIYEKMIAKDSLNLVLTYQLAKLYLVKKDAEKAVSVFKYLEKNDVSNANYSYQLGVAYGIKNDRNRMMNSFLKAYKKDALHLKAIVHLASSFNKLKDRDSTKIFVDKGLVLDKNHINLNKLKINQLYREKKFLETLPYLLNIDTIYKKDTYSTSMLGRVYYNIDSLGKAKIYFKKLWRLDRENYKAKTYLGHIAMKEKDYKRASLNYMMATYIGKEKRDEEYYGLASVYFETKKPKKAIYNYEKACKENSKNYKALFQLAKISDDYYKDKKIAYKHYLRYLENFKSKDVVMTNFVKKRILAIKKEYFMKGDSLE